MGMGARAEPPPGMRAPRRKRNCPKGLLLQSKRNDCVVWVGRTLTFPEGNPGQSNLKGPPTLGKQGGKGGGEYAFITNKD